MTYMRCFTNLRFKNCEETANRILQYFDLYAVSLYILVPCTPLLKKPIKLSVYQAQTVKLKLFYVLRLLVKPRKLFQAAVFVSTAYSNCIHDVVKEEFYDPPFPLQDLLVLLDRLTPSESDILLPKIIGACPNAYIFSKAMSENAILMEAQGIPASVVRPSVVFPTIREPVMGWLENIYGPISIIYGVGVGILRVIYSEEKKLIDIVPADIVANCVVAAAYSSSKRSDNESITIYNSTISDNNPLTQKEFIQPLSESVMDNYLKECIWHPFIIQVTNYKIYLFLAFFLHFLPGCLLDLGLRLTKKPPMFLKIYRKLQNHVLQTGYFTKRNIMFCTDNTRKMLNELDVKDREIFSFDTTLINWRKIILRSCVEALKYVLGGRLHTVEDKSSRQLKLYIVHLTVKYFFYGLLLWIVWRVLRLYTCDWF